MVKSPPPTFEGDVDHFYDTNFAAEVSSKMRVPKRIKLGGGDASDDDLENGYMETPQKEEKIEMRVPDRILVVGQDQHIGTQAPPFELEVENTIMPPDPGMIRVSTPPRVITLDEHYFPSAAEDFENAAASSSSADYRPSSVPHTNAKVGSHVPKFSRKNSVANHSDFAIDTSIDTYNSNHQLAVVEEVMHLRRQLAKMNRRVMGIERDMLAKQQRDKMVVTICAAYLLVKLIFWINRSP